MIGMKDSIVTAIVATYNPKLNDLKKTLKSILLQEDVIVEIIITDDGSVHFPYESIENYMKENRFSNYKIICNQENKGTVYNIFSGLKVASGSYVKLISPGDCLSSSHALHQLLHTIKRDDADMTFGEVVYYLEGTKEFTLKRHYAHPQTIKPYLNKMGKSLWYNYLILDDTIHGVSTLCKKEILYRYIERAINVVIYSEDSLYRVMVNEQVTITYCPEVVVLYSYGGGISTMNDSKWKRLMKTDLQATDQMIISKIKNPKQLELFKAAIIWRDYKSIRNLIKIVLKSPSFLSRKIIRAINKRYTSIEYNDNFYMLCCAIDE